MRPAAFTYSRPTTLAETLRAVAAGAVPLAGGQSLLAAMRLRHSEPDALVDLARVAELDADIVFSDTRVTIGALVTHRQLLNDSRMQAELPWLVEAAQALGDVQVRNLGTVLGNLCWADCRANMVVALLASDAVVAAVSPDRPAAIERIQLAGFFRGFRRTALDGRLAIAIEVPRCAGARGRYLEFSRQRQDLALVNVCAVRADNAVRIAVGGIDPVPVRLQSVEAALTAGDASALERALTAGLAPAAHAPIADQHGSAAYKLDLARTLVRRATSALGA